MNAERANTMKAAVQYGLRDIRVEEVETPKLAPGEVLLRVRACGICGTDLHQYKLNMYPELGIPAGAGIILGHEFSGEVAQLGDGVEGLKVGDRVISSARGGNAEYIRIPAASRPLIIPFPDSMSFEEGALHSVNLANPKDDETIVVLGMGLIGMGVLQVLKAVCKARIVAVDVSEKRLNMAKQIGADIVVDAGKINPYEYMLKMTGSTKIPYLEYPVSGVDTVFDCAGQSADAKGQPPLWQAWQMVKQNGKVVEVALFEKSCNLDLNIITRKGICLFGSWAWSTQEFSSALELIKTGKVDRKPLITHTFPLDEAKQAYETQLNSREAIKVVITP